jgi:hypothetical protein
MNSAQPNVIGKKAYSIDEFCQTHGISRAFYYKLRSAGKGPVEMEVGARRLISDESGAAWRKQREAV